MDTMAYACFVARSRSFCAPVEISPNTSSSAARPPSSEHIWSSSWSFVVICRSCGRYHAAPSAFPLGTMVTFSSGWACSSIHDTVACPASW